MGYYLDRLHLCSRVKDLLATVAKMYTGDQDLKDMHRRQSICLVDEVVGIRQHIYTKHRSYCNRLDSIDLLDLYKFRAALHDGKYYTAAKHWHRLKPTLSKHSLG